MFKYYNPNPKQNLVGDCVIRAISKAEYMDWEKTYIDICVKGYQLKDMPSSNNVWGAYLYEKGYRQGTVCPNCTVKDFCYGHPHGVYILATGTHVICVVNGDYYDTWDSGEEIPIYYWERKF